MKKKPLVSLVIRTKDRPHLLQESLNSIYRQTYRPIEVILVNDGGCDINYEEVSSVSDDILFNYVRLDKNRGRAAAGNVGIKKATGRYIGFLDDDDELFPDHIETLVETMQHSENRIVYSDCEMVKFAHNVIQGSTVQERYVDYSEDFSYEKLLLANYIPIICLLFDSTIRDDIIFDETFDLYEDWDLLLRLGKDWPFHHVKKVTARCNLCLEPQIVTEGKYHYGAFKKIAGKHLEKINPDVLFKNWQCIVHSRKISRDNEKLRSHVDVLQNVLRDKETAVHEQQDIISHLKMLLQEHEDIIHATQEMLRKKEEAITRKHQEIIDLQLYLNKLQSSLGWMMLQSARKIIERALPVHTKRRYYYDLIVKSIKITKTHGINALYHKGRRKLSTKCNMHLRENAFHRSRPENHTERKVDIIIPVYNAFDDVIECFKSVVQTMDGLRHRLILIDDKSTDLRIPEVLRELQHQYRELPVIILTNDNNLGFSKSVNRGMHFSERDVILLNSDTIVTEKWIEKLTRAAYSRPEVATVTPFSNNATICSIPLFCETNLLPDGFTLQEFGQFIENISLRYYPEIPTGVGCCMYIKRNVLNQIGYFDEVRFKDGYGEENDFCWRAKKSGFINILDDATYIYHRGGVSFTNEVKLQREAEALNIMEKLHPDYIANVQQFIRENPLKQLHEYLSLRFNI